MDLEKIKNGNIEEILEYSITDEQIKSKIKEDPKISKSIEKWLKKYVGQSHINGIKDCMVEYIDYDNLVDTLEEMDEFDEKELSKTIKKNINHCPNHRSCPLFLSNTLPIHDKCPLELVDTEILIKGLAQELEIEMGDFNDSILIQQLVSLNVVYNRAMRGMAATPMIETIVSYTKGGVNYDTKVNEYFNIIESSLNMMEKLRKSLILNRDDKIKYKKIKQANSMEEIRKNVLEQINNVNEAIDMAEVVSEVIASDDEIGDIDG